MSSAFDSHDALQKFVALIGLFLSAILLGIFLATDSIGVLYMGMGLGWLFLLPYHAKLAVFLGISTFSSALIIPYVPGRPYVWEFGAMLAWTGLLLTIALRQYSKDVGETLRAQKWLFFGLIGYCLNLLFIMKMRGVGFRVLGADSMGGRFYLQQLICAIFPLIFAFVPLTEKALTRMLTLQFLLSTTYLVSDFIFSVAPQSLYFLLGFFELPGDALTFEMQAMNLGLRRLQSWYVIGISMFFLLLTRVKMSDFLTGRGVFLIPLGLAPLAIGLLGGHRMLLVHAGLTCLFLGWGQRFFVPRNLVPLGATAALILAIAYTNVERLPIAAQRTLSALPGIEVNRLAFEDGYGTLETRKLLRQIGWEMAPQYYWVGRGFAQSVDFSHHWDSTSIVAHVNQGRFYNGFIGLLVNTGLPGTFFLCLFLLGGTFVAFKILQFTRRHGANDVFSRAAGLVASIWCAMTIEFLFVHGDSEYALKSFGLMAGVLIGFERLLRVRSAALADAATVEQEAPRETEEVTPPPRAIVPVGF
ncbi:MAG TPA: hypothetical protein VEH27_09785 [Methylomirabilota bacterium]|nr:hypothetical protein [Methylomirabilota bacterium]